MRLATGGRRSVLFMTVQATAVLATLWLVAGCVPVFGERWTRQPLQGQVVDAHTGAPLSGVLVSAAAFTDARGVTDSDGHFDIPGHADVGGQMLMPASMLRPQCWKVERDGYQTLWIEVMEMLPDTRRQPITVNLPLLAFDEEALAGHFAETMVKERSTVHRVWDHSGNEALSRAIQHDNYRWRLAEGRVCGAALPTS